MDGKNQQKKACWRSAMVAYEQKKDIVNATVFGGQNKEISF